MPNPHPRDPLHGVTLKALLEDLVARHGWEALGEQVPVRCFLNEPSLSSSLKFLRKTPWARSKVEAIYLSDLATSARNRKRNERRAQRRALASDIPLERDETLALVWPATATVPDPLCPDGYTLRRVVDPAAFRAVQRAIGFEVTEEIWNQLVLVKGAMVFAEDEEGPVAVALAEPRPGGWVEIGWVAVDPAHRGHGLGASVCRELMTLLLDGAQTRIFGSTQDARIQALRIYLEMGFEPVERPEKQDRWAAVHALLGRPETARS